MAKVAFWTKAQSLVMFDHLGFLQFFRHPSQHRWGASNSLIIMKEEGGEGEISF